MAVPSRSIVALFIVAIVAGPAIAPAQPLNRMDVYKARVDPNWIDDTHFWYRNDLRGGRREFVLVDAGAGIRAPAFDHQRLADAASQATGKSYAADRLPVTISAVNGRMLTLRIDDTTWKCELDTYQLSAAENTATTAPATRPTEQSGNRPRGFRDGGDRGAIVRQGNLFVRGQDGAEKQLSSDGREGFGYGRYFWSPDRTKLVAFRTEIGDHLPVYRLESSPRGRGGASGGGVGRVVLQTGEYALPGDKLDSCELNVFEVESGKQIKPEVERIDASAGGSHARPRIYWRPDGKRFLYEKHDRGHQRLRLIEIDSTTGAARTVLDEQPKTFIWTAHTEDLRLQILNYLANGREVIYVSERSGWRQLYLLDLDSGELKPMTQGQWVLRGIHRIDEEARQVWFSACGVYPGQDPYLLHYGRVNFDGSGLTWLTEANGTHELDFTRRSTIFSPDEKFLVVTHSRVDLPPVSELRRVSDGKLIVKLESAEVDGDWTPLEVFTAKGRDGTTGIWGVIRRPPDFDPAKKYPIVESVYAGPQGAFVPKSFRARSSYDALARRGFIVVQADGMGTAFRSKAFHDVCWQNLADAGFPDRVAWIKAAAQKYPYMDLERVGIYGTSAGGQSAAGALIFHSDFYKAAVANCGCHDNRMDKMTWNEQWMGYPVGPHYSACSNIDNAGKLKGHLQLVLGELDDNVPVESTYRLVNALVQAGKEFDFVFIPGAGHGTRGPYAAYTTRKLQDFFVRHLQGTEPASPN